MPASNNSFQWAPPAEMSTDHGDYSHGQTAIGDVRISTPVPPLVVGVETVDPVVAVERARPCGVTDELVAFAIDVGADVFDD